MNSNGFVCPYHCVGPIPYVYNFVVSKFLTLWVLLQVIYSQLLFTSTCLVKFTCVIMHIRKNRHFRGSNHHDCCIHHGLLVKSCKNLSFLWLQTPIFPCFFHVKSRSRLATAAGRRGRSPSGRNARSPTASAILQGKSLRDGVLKGDTPFFPAI